MALDDLLSRLANVRKAGNGWRADCPHGHRSRGSLSIAEGDNGAVLLRCWSGCDSISVLQAVGLNVADLFPERIKPATPEQRRELRTRLAFVGVGAAASVLAAEAGLVLIAGNAQVRGEMLTGDDLARLCVAVERIDACAQTLRRNAA